MKSARRVLLPLSLSLLCSAPGVAESAIGTSVYVGTIGNLPVVMQFGVQDSAYFYTRHGLSISLSRQKQGSALLLQEHLSSALDQGDVTTSTGSMRLAARPNGWSGTWQAAGKGPRLPVRLSLATVTPLDGSLVSSTGFQKLQRQDLFNYLRLNHAWTQGAPGVHSAGLPTVREPLSGVSYPRVPGATPVNAALQDLQAQDALDALDCQASAPDGSPQAAWDVQTQVTRLSTKLLSLQTVGTAFCGGAHPGDVAMAETLDLQTGQPVDVRTLFAGLTDAQLRDAYLASYPKSNPSCADAVKQLLTQTPDPLTPTSFLSNSGLSLWLPDLPHVAFACNAAVTLSFASVKAAFRGDQAILADLYH